MKTTLVVIILLLISGCGAAICSDTTRAIKRMENCMNTPGCQFDATDLAYYERDKKIYKYRQCGDSNK